MIVLKIILAVLIIAYILAILYAIYLPRIVVRRWISHKDYFFVFTTYPKGKPYTEKRVIYLFSKYNKRSKYCK